MTYTGVGGVLGEIFHLDAAQEATPKRRRAAAAYFVLALDAQGHRSVVAAKGAAAALMTRPQIPDHGARGQRLLFGRASGRSRSRSGRAKGQKVMKWLIWGVGRHAFAKCSRRKHV